MNYEYCRRVVEAEPSFAQVASALGIIPLEKHAIIYALSVPLSMSTYFPITQETLVDIIYTQIFRYAPSAQAESVLISAIACYGAWAVTTGVSAANA